MGSGIAVWLKIRIRAQMAVQYSSLVFALSEWFICNFHITSNLTGTKNSLLLFAALTILANYFLPVNVGVMF